jgi:hypothetical protein
VESPLLEPPFCDRSDTRFYGVRDSFGGRLRFYGFYGGRLESEQDLGQNASCRGTDQMRVGCPNAPVTGHGLGWHSGGRQRAEDAELTAYWQVAQGSVPLLGSRKEALQAVREEPKQHEIRV